MQTTGNRERKVWLDFAWKPAQFWNKIPWTDEMMGREAHGKGEEGLVIQSRITSDEFQIT